MIGASTAGSSTLPTRLANLTASAPAATQVAPIRPPINACDELEGSPTSQVSRFHTIAPTSPAKITVGVIFVSSTSPLEIVFATWTDRNAPTRLRTPAMSTAVRGFSAPVAIEVATALAVSWKPLVKSNASAVTMTTTMITEISMRPSLGQGNDQTLEPYGCGGRTLLNSGRTAGEQPAAIWHRPRRRARTRSGRPPARRPGRPWTRRHRRSNGHRQ